MRIHILGIGGTFMGGLAVLARALGHSVSGSDTHVYPPMSTQLAAQDITLNEGYDPAQLEPAPDLVVIGNALSRGNPMVEAVLDRGLPYTSGPAWLAEQVLRRAGTHKCRGRQDAGSDRNRWVLAVAGTHGKTTTSSLLAWILESAGHAPGFLIGGVPENFGVSARLGASPFFVIEADEYDTAFFDKRSKFVHYRPRTLILNNLEYDHADIFPDLAAIQRQFHHLVRTVPGSGRLLVHAQDSNLDAVLQEGCWTPVERFGDNADWSVHADTGDYRRFRVTRAGQTCGTVTWELLGRHNAMNALAAIAAAAHAGVAPADAIAALADFRNVKRRLELRGVVHGIRVYDDFAHHPTAIAATLGALRASVGDRRIVAVLEPRSNTMRLGVHRDELAGALAAADRVVLLQPPDLNWDLGAVGRALAPRAQLFVSVEAILDALAAELQNGDHVLIMSNGDFGGLHAKLLERLGTAAHVAKPGRGA